MMGYKSIVAFLLTLLLGCKSTQPVQKATTKTGYPTTSYLTIKLDEERRLPSNPYILEFEKGKKRLVFCGVNHLTDNSDTANVMYKSIEQKFFQVKPDVSVNEGGDVSNRKYKSKYDALVRGGEIGLIKVLSDSLKILTVCGDADTPFEFSELLKTYSKGELLAYVVTERFMWSIKNETLNEAVLQRLFDRFVQNYIIKDGGVALTETEKTFDFFKENYEKLLNRPFRLAELEPTDPFDPNGRFQAIGRTSKEIRDQFLLKSIDNLLDKYDSVFVVFGGWHLLTCEPGLRAIMDKKAQ
jgi:hypothetical protein